MDREEGCGLKYLTANIQHAIPGSPRAVLKPLPVLVKTGGWAGLINTSQPSCDPANQEVKKINPTADLCNFTFRGRQHLGPTPTGTERCYTPHTQLHTAHTPRYTKAGSGLLLRARRHAQPRVQTDGTWRTPPAGLCRGSAASVWRGLLSGTSHHSSPRVS